MFFKSKKEQQNQDQTDLGCLMQNDGPLISMRNIEKSYQNKAGKTSILQKINLDIEQGDFITIMGPSGAGKSTLLHIMGMLDSDWTGEYHLLGNAVHNLKRKERNGLNKQTVGVVFQSLHLLDSLSVYENLDTPLSYRNINSSERASIVCDTLDKFGIVGKKDLFPGQLSGGQQQLVAVARAVISKPKLILADEPTGNLHTKQGEEIMELFARLNKEGTTIVQVTHSERNAKYSQRIINLWDGIIRNEMQSVELEGE